MRNLVLAFCALVVLIVAAPVFGQADNQVTNPDPCQGTMNIDTCMWSDTGNATVGGITSCTTTDGCLKCGNDVFTGTAQCSRIARSDGSCECTVSTSYANRTWTTSCTGSGACTYKSS